MDKEQAKIIAKAFRERPTLYEVDVTASAPIIIGYVIAAMKNEEFTQEQQENYVNSVVASIDQKTQVPTLVSFDEFIAKSRVQIRECNRHLLGKVPQEIIDKYNLHI